MSIQKINHYQFGKIIINDQIYQKDLIIFPDKITPNWRREKGHTLSMNDLKDVVLAQPKTIIIGTGMFGRLKIPKETTANLEAEGFEVIAEKTEKACQIFNSRYARGEVIAALHLTC